MKTLAAVLLASFLPVYAAAAGPPSQASKVIGLTAVDAKNRRLGVVTDLVVDLETAKITGLQVGRATADGMAQSVVPWGSVQLREDKVIVNAAPIAGEAPEAQSLEKILHAPLRDKEGKVAGNISDLMVTFDDARLANFVLQFDPKWLDMAAPAAVPLNALERKDDGFVVKFSANDVRPAGGPKTAAPAPPPPPPPVLRTRVSQLADATAIEAFAKAPANLATARQLLSARMINPSNEVVGKVEEVVVDKATGKLDFIVASFRPDWVATGWLVILPVRPVITDPSGQPAVRITLSEINHAFLFQASSWPDFTNPAVGAAIHAKIDYM